MNTEHKEFKSFSDFLLNSELDEAKGKRKEIKKFTEEISPQIRIHFVKLSCFDNPDDIRGHFNSLDTWIDDIQELTFNGNKRLPRDDYFKYIWSDKIKDFDDFEELFLEVKDLYKDVYPRKNLKLSKIYSQLTRLSEELSKEISEIFFTSTKFLFDRFKIDYQ